MGIPVQILSLWMTDLFVSESNAKVILAVFVFLVALFLMAHLRIKKRDSHFQKAHYDRLRDFWTAFEDPHTRQLMSAAFISKYGNTKQQKGRMSKATGIPNVWSTLQTAVDMDRERLLKDDEAFAEAVAFTGEGLCTDAAKVWRVGPTSIYVDIPVRDKESFNKPPFSVDLGLVVGEGFSRGEFSSDAELYSLLTSELGIVDDENSL